MRVFRFNILGANFRPRLRTVTCSRVTQKEVGLSMTKLRVLALVSALVLLSALPGVAGTVGYDIKITTGYGFSNPFIGSTFLGGGSPGPDTGFVEITNLGTTTFNGSLGTIAVSSFAGDLSFSVPSYT